MNSSQKSEYGELLTKIIKDKKMTQADFYSKLGIKKPYFYDIIGGKINPPPPETQLKILKILHPEQEDIKRLLEIASRDRNEMPADILIYFKKNANAIESIRKEKDYKDFIGGIIDE